MAERRIEEAWERLRGLVGKAGPEVRGAISRRQIERFAVASGESEAIYSDEEAAGAAGYGGIPCPPLLLSSVLEWGAGPALSELREDGTGVGREAWLPLDGLRLMGGGQDLELGRPVLAGEEFRARPVLAAVDRKQGSAGPLLFLTIETESRTAAGETLVVCRETLIAA